MIKKFNENIDMKFIIFNTDFIILNGNKRRPTIKKGEILEIKRQGLYGFSTPGWIRHQDESMVDISEIPIIVYDEWIDNRPKGRTR